MDFFLVRHGEAKPETEDSRRPLTRRGQEEVEAVARATSDRGVQVRRIFYSEKLRAKETAEILARYLSPVGGAGEFKGLAPEDDPMLAKAELEAAEGSLMLVGHLPHLGRLTSMLVTGDSEKEVVNFPAAAVFCLSQGGKSWKLHWTLDPADLRE
ncbi:MAG: phosphohistidine phosphatase SixA [Candidatus Binatia bacterium]|jgi:phosphohistidine phosphatase|nr:phosphohistidine phosphatase SixA [Candidatus Binatia bacterium]